MKKKMKDNNQKSEKELETRGLTSLSGRFYITLGIVSLIFILLSVAEQVCACIQVCIGVLGKTLIEIMAAGMLPAVLLAWLTDLVTTKQRNDDFKKRILVHKQQLKNLCLDLPSEILVCLNTPDYAEDSKKRSFVEWCEQLSNDEKKLLTEAKYYSFYLHEVEKEASDFWGYLNTFGECMPDAIRSPEMQKVKKLSCISKSLCNMLKQKNRKTIDCKLFVQRIADLNNAVLEVFTEKDEDSKCEIIDSEISKYYKGKYNSETFEVEGQEKT